MIVSGRRQTDSATRIQVSLWLFLKWSETFRSRKTRRRSLVYTCKAVVGKNGIAWLQVKQCCILPNFAESYIHTCTVIIMHTNYLQMRVFIQLIFQCFFLFLQLPPPLKTFRFAPTLSLFIHTELRLSVITVEKCCGGWCVKALNVKVKSFPFLAQWSTCWGYLLVL